MRHNSNLVIYNKSFINERVRFNVQSTVFKRPFADNVLRMLIRNSCALIHVFDVVLTAFLFNLNIIAFEQE
jgi:hypothetical protein